jgi:hypothetical protein
VRDRIAFWREALWQGLGQLNTVAGWVGTIILGLSVIAGIVVPVLFHLSHWLIAVILVGLLTVVVAEGSYEVWHETDQQRLAAQEAAPALAPAGDDLTVTINRLILRSVDDVATLAEVDYFVRNNSQSPRRVNVIGLRGLPDSPQREVGQPQTSHLYQEIAELRAARGAERPLGVISPHDTAQGVWIEAVPSVANNFTLAIRDDLGRYYTANVVEPPLPGPRAYHMSGF